MLEVEKVVAKWHLQVTQEEFSGSLGLCRLGCGIDAGGTDVALMARNAREFS